MQTLKYLIAILLLSGLGIGGVIALNKYQEDRLAERHEREAAEKMQAEWEAGQAETDRRVAAVAQQRKERANREQAEEAAAIELQNRRAEAARLEREADVTKQAVEAVRNLIDRADPNGEVFGEVHSRDDTVVIVVRSTWHFWPKGQRMEVATSLWKHWASNYKPDNPDIARIELTDSNGRVVGGSRIWAGSLIWVDD
jgi:hypothetical protein